MCESMLARHTLFATNSNFTSSILTIGLKSSEKYLPTLWVNYIHHARLFNLLHAKKCYPGRLTWDDHSFGSLRQGTFTKYSGRKQECSYWLLLAGNIARPILENIFHWKKFRRPHLWLFLGLSTS